MKSTQVRQVYAWHNEDAYVLAIEVGNYRAALRECIRALRRVQSGTDRELWRFRLIGAFARRNRGR